MSKKPLIISFSSKARHGKDSSCLILKNKLESQGKKVMILAYANYLKYIHTTYFNGSYEKNEVNRTAWQKLGQMVRDIDENYWVDTIIDFVKVLCKDYDYVLISDSRHPNEIRRWADKGYNYIAVHIERLNFENDLTELQRSHISENALDNFNFDYYIESENGLDCLEKEIDSFIEWISMDESEVDYE